jgi:hypothetical protein
MTLSVEAVVMLKYRQISLASTLIGHRMMFAHSARAAMKLELWEKERWIPRQRL